MKKDYNKKITQFFQKYNKEQIEMGLYLLNTQRREIVELRYGLNDKSATDVIEIAKRFNVTIDSIYKVCRKFEYKLNLIKKYNSIEFARYEKNNEFFKLFPNSSKKEEILCCLNSLNIETKQIIEFIYGLNEKEVLTVKQIADKLNMSIYSVYQKSKTGENNIKRLLMGKVKIEPNMDIFELFSKYDKKQVLSAIESLSELNKQIVKTKYLSDKVVSNKELAKQFNMNENMIAQRLKYSKKLMLKFLNPQLAKKTSKKIKLLKEFNQYSEKQILLAINHLSTVKRSVMELRYGLNGNEQIDIEEIAMQLNRSKSSIYKIISYAKKDMNILLKNPNCPNQMHEFYRSFSDYSIEEINLILNLINSHHKEILEKRYGLNGQQRISISAIAIENNICNSTVSVIINNSKKKIADKLEEVFANRNCFFNNFSNYAPEKIENSFKFLDLYDRRILEMFYGLHGQPIMNIDEIAKLFLITTKEIVTIIINTKKKILKNLQKIDMQEKENIKTLNNNKNLELIKDYVKQLIEQLNDPMEKTVLLLRLGFVRDTNYTEKQIASLLYISEEKVKIIFRTGLVNLKDICVLANQKLEINNKYLKFVK